MCHSALMGGAGGSSSDDELGGGLFGAGSDGEGEGDSGFVAGVFSYDAYELDADAREVCYYYSHRDGATHVALARFSTSLALPVPPAAGALPAGAHAAAFQAGLASLPGLWLGLPTRVIAVRAGALDAAACAFWAATYDACLGEFFQAHRLPWPGALRVECDAMPRPLSPRGCAGGVAAPEVAPRAARRGARRVLVPLGGGKDSLTVWELLRAADVGAATWFYLEDEVGEFDANWRLAALVAASGCAAPALVACHRWRCPAWEAARRRTFEPCGHPWALLVAFAATLVAVLHGCDAVAVGNERSAGEGNGSYNGCEVNHQHDKSLAFELAAAAHIRRCVTRRVRYFSALSHLWEVQVAQRFCAPAIAGRYLRLFTSCNEAAARPGGAAPSRACGRCPKCLFVALLLAAFCADPREGWAFAGDDLLQDASLAPLLDALLGRDGAAKPLDCVGTRREVALCVARARDAYAAAGLRVPALLADARAEADAAEGRTHAAMLDAADGPHAVPHWAAAACGADPARYMGPPDSSDEDEPA